LQLRLTRDECTTEELDIIRPCQLWWHSSATTQCLKKPILDISAVTFRVSICPISVIFAEIFHLFCITV